MRLKGPRGNQLVSNREGKASGSKQVIVMKDLNHRG